MGLLGMYWGVRGVLGSSGEYRYYRSNRWPLEGIRGCWGCIAVVRGVLGADRECRYSGARRV